RRAGLGAGGAGLNRLAMAYPGISFQLPGAGRSLVKLPAANGDLFAARLERLSGVIGRDFFANALPIAAEREGVRLTGHAGLPTYHRATAQHQYLFVNGRPVRDQPPPGAVRAAYSAFRAPDRPPAG